MSISPFTAHPHVDPVDGRLQAIGYEDNGVAEGSHFVFEADGTPASRIAIALGGPSSIHNFAMTRRFLVLQDLPRQHDGALPRRVSRLPIAGSRITTRGSA